LLVYLFTYNLAGKIVSTTHQMD